MRQICFEIIIFVVRLKAKVLKFRKKGQRGNGLKNYVLVLEPCPTSFGSNGDEALTAGLCRFINESDPSCEVELLSFYDEYKGCLPQSVKYAGSLKQTKSSNLQKLKNYFQWPALLIKYKSFYVIGADMIDGYYSDSVSKMLFTLALIADSAGVKTNIVSCSFNDKSSLSVQRRLRSLPSSIRIHSRDVYSAERLSRVTGRAVSHSADVAFGLQPKATDLTQHVCGWISNERKKSRLVIGVNVNLLPIRIQFPGKEQEYALNWAQWCNLLASWGVSIIFLPHDYRGDLGDDKAANQVYSLASDSVRKSMYNPSERLHAWEIKNITKECDFVVTGRMHLAIAALGSGTPVLCYAYQSKFEGILALFEQYDVVRPIENVFSDIAKEAVFAKKVLGERDERKERIRANIGRVLELASRNV